MSRAAYERDPRWRQAMTLAVEVYHLTSAFPAEEKSGLAAALRRAASTLPLRIAEAVDAHDDAEAKGWSAAHDLLRDMEATALICRRLRFLGWRDMRRLRAAIRRLDDRVHDVLDALREPDGDRGLHLAG